MNFVKMVFNEKTKIVNMENTENEQRFAHAALAVFKRFGARKATMEEIAAEAGVSKPTLYATFRNKDAALAGAIRFSQGALLDKVREDWKSTPALGPKLDIFFEKLVIRGFDMLHGAPDASAFENAVGDASSAAIVETREAEILALAEAMKDSAGLARNGLNPESFARFTVNAAMNEKRQASQREDLIGFLETLKKCVLIVAG